MKQMCREMTWKGLAKGNNLVSAAELWAVGRHIPFPYTPGVSSTKQDKLPAQPTAAWQQPTLRPCLAPGTTPGCIKSRYYTLMCFHCATLFFTAILYKTEQRDTLICPISDLVSYSSVNFCLCYVPTVSNLNKPINHWYASVSSFRRSLVSLSR